MRLVQPDMRHALRALAGGVGRAHLVSRRTWGATPLELFTHWPFQSFVSMSNDSSSPD